MSDQETNQDEASPGPVTCPGCGAEETGNFCAQCGTPLKARFCTACGERTKPADRFCTSCGATLGGGPQTTAPPVGTSPPPRAARTPSRPSKPVGTGASAGQPGLTQRQPWITWVVVALLLGGGAAIIGYSTRPGAGTPAAGGGSPGALGASAVDLSSMTPREAADRLFNRVVAASERGDSQEMMQFLPMSIDAYDVAEPLDDDGYFHKTILQRLAGDWGGAIATAEIVLERAPNHLLILASAAEAARDAGDIETARGYYQRFLDAYDAEMEKNLPEYQAHQTMLPGMQEDATQVVQGGADA